MENELIQGSPAWHEFRKSGIGASEASVCLDVNPWRTAYDLWLEKCGLKAPAPSNYAMKRGLEMEAPAIEWAERELGVSFRPTVRKSRIHGFMFASIDGISDDGLAIEIKNPMNGLHETVPDYYMPQLQHQMFVLETTQMIYMSFDGVQGKIIEVDADYSYIEKLIEAERLFWNHVKTFTEPELSERDYVKRDDPAYIEKLRIYLNNKQQMKYWEDLAERSKQDLVAMTTENTSCNGCKIAQRTRQGAIDYKTLTKDLEIGNDVISKYRKPPISFYEIRENRASQ